MFVAIENDPSEKSRVDSIRRVHDGAFYKWYFYKINLLYKSFKYYYVSVLFYYSLIILIIQVKLNQDIPELLFTILTKDSNIIVDNISVSELDSRWKSPMCKISNTKARVLDQIFWYLGSAPNVLQTAFNYHFYLAVLPWTRSWWKHQSPLWMDS